MKKWQKKIRFAALLCNGDLRYEGFALQVIGVFVDFVIQQTARRYTT